MSASLKLGTKVWYFTKAGISQGEIHSVTKHKKSETGYRSKTQYTVSPSGCCNPTKYWESQLFTSRKKAIKSLKVKK